MDGRPSPPPPRRPLPAPPRSGTGPPLRSTCMTPYLGNGHIQPQQKASRASIHIRFGALKNTGS